MVAPTSDYRPLLSGGLWLAGTAAIVAALYAVGGGSSIAAALAFDYVLVTVAAWAARDIHRKRDFPAPAVESPEPVDAPSSTPAIDPARAAVQFQSSVLGAIAVIIGLLAGLQLLQLTPTEVRMADDDTVIGIICLAGTFVWLVLARAFQSIPRNDLPEVTPLMSAFREGQWTTLIAAAGLLGAPLHPLIVYWVTRILLVWIVIVCGEAILRIGVLMLVPAEDHHPPVAPIQSLLREAIFAAANPVSSLVRTFEDRFGVSVRSSWAIAFVKNATLPLMIMLIVLGWALTSLAIVETHQMAVREHFGRVVGSPLKPGLHFMLPWPFGRMKAFPVKTVQQLPIGFVEAEDDAEMTNRDRPRALLWTKPHAKEEFALALGDGSELVAVNALVYFKVSENPDEFLEYVYQQSAPEEALTAFAYRALMEQTRGRTLDDVLSANRAEFSRRVADSVRQQAKDAKLGLDVVDLALLNLHPPIEAGAEYLEVINARLDARRRVIEAEGEKQVALLDAQMRGTTAIAAAKVNRSRRVAGALSDMAEFQAVEQAHQASPKTFRLRLWLEALESALINQRLILVDHTLLDDGGGLLLDTRPLHGRRMPDVDAPSPFNIPGPEHND